MTDLRISASKPFADGIQFDDLYGLDDADRNMLASRGVVYCTEFKSGGRRYGGNIIARSLEDAEHIAFGRGLDEVVVGTMAGTGKWLL